MPAGTTRPALILHGGAGARRERNYDREIVHMREVVEAMKARLEDGASALDVVVEATAMLEESGLYVAGRGASPNLAGAYELDADPPRGSRRGPARLQEPDHGGPGRDGPDPPRHAGRRGRGPVRDGSGAGSHR